MKEFNIVISGVGGQGIITLAKIITNAAFIQGYDVKMSELHGLAQRGGHIECHVRINKKIYSPLVKQANADLIIALEPIEALRTCYYASNKTTILLNTNKIIPLSIYTDKKAYPSKEKITKTLKTFSKKIIEINASEIVKEKTKSLTTVNTYLLGYAYSKKLIPIKKEFLLSAISKIIPEKYFELNKKVFNLFK